jgi:hypothetical protein
MGLTEFLFALGAGVIGISQVGLLTGIFFRLGHHNARLDGLEKSIEAIWERINKWSDRL